MDQLSGLAPLVAKKLRRLERRCRGRKALIAACGGSLALAAGVVAVLIVEALHGWSVGGLRAANLALLAVAAASAISIGRAWQRRISWPRVAAQVEDRFPELEERLVSAVELSQAGTAAHGAVPLIDDLHSQTAAQTRELDFRQACPMRSSWRLALATLGIVLTTMVPFVVSERWSAFGRRLLAAWSDAVHGFVLHVEPGDGYVGRGRLAIVTARLHRTDPRACLPHECFVVISPAQGQPQRRLMEPVDDGVFTFTWSALETPVAYRVEAGELVSPTYRLELVEPVEVLPDGLAVRIEPPPYVRPESLPAVVRPGGEPFTALQYSRVEIAFRINRVPAGATIYHHRAGADAPSVVPLPITGTELRWQWLARDAGPQRATLVLEAEHGVITQLALPTGTVWTDDAPQLQGAIFSATPLDVSEAKRVPPGDTLPIRASAVDRVGLGRIDLEYRINEGPIRVVPLADGQGRTTAEIDGLWTLPDSAKDGDRVQVRLRCEDNRRLAKDELRVGEQSGPDRELGPNVVYLPAGEQDAERWWSLRVEARVEALVKQEALVQRAVFQDELERIKKELIRERDEIAKLR
ncbi:MAG: hypothetical protein NZO58_14135, partial [Gemmataceae bacterium]|nr:hypothetical protein [Gemmataceae bacterium]